MTVSRAELLEELLPGLERLFGVEYRNYAASMTRVEYVKKFSYGKYSIYKYVLTYGQRQSSETLAKGLTKEEADGFLKLLKENKE
jgi:hypothetical protein